jgi:hypothetical protein
VASITELGQAGEVTLFYDGNAVGSGRVERTIPMGFSADEACDVGMDTGSPASGDYGPAGNRFTGEIAWARIDVGGDGHDHLISAEDRMNIATARQ